MTQTHEDLINKINYLEMENSLLKEKISSLETIISNNDLQKNYSNLNTYFPANLLENNLEVELDSPVFKCIPYIKRMNAFNYSNEDVIV